MDFDFKKFYSFRWAPGANWEPIILLDLPDHYLVVGENLYTRSALGLVYRLSTVHMKSESRTGLHVHFFISSIPRDRLPEDLGVGEWWGVESLPTGLLHLLRRHRRHLLPLLPPDWREELRKIDMVLSQRFWERTMGTSFRLESGALVEYEDIPQSYRGVLKIYSPAGEPILQLEIPKIPKCYLGDLREWGEFHLHLSTTGRFKFSPLSEESEEPLGLLEESEPTESR